MQFTPFFFPFFWLSSVVYAVHPTNSCKGAKPVNNFQEKEEGGRGRFKSHTNAPDRISDRVKKAPLKT
jgi:hypothetical protein